MKRISIIVLLLITYFGAAQDTLVISKEEVLQRIVEENLQAKIAEKDFLSARADYRQSNAVYLPQISVSHTAISTTNPLMAFGSKLNQEILTQADFNPALLNDPVRTENFATQIDVLQPILNFDGLLERRAAKLKSEAMALQTERTKEYLTLEGAKAYMQLQLSYQAVSTLEKAKETLEAHYTIVQDYFDQGMVQKSDVLKVEVKLNEVTNQLAFAQSGIKNISDYLGFLLNEKGKRYVPTEELLVKAPENQADITFSESRKDIQALQKAMDARHKMYQSSKMSFMPRLNAFANYQMYDDQLFQTGAKGYLVGAQLSWDVFKGYQNIGKKQKAKMEYQKASIEKEHYVSKSQMEFNSTQRTLVDAYNKVELFRLAKEQAQEVYRITQDRYRQGLERSADVLEAQTELMAKELSYSQALFEYNFTQHYLEFLTK
ncbi:MAG: TolC family protein [Flavobacteriales bacterium]|nr:TolC family protein [Flavobacteriales bacterium]